jgi:CRP-like cAMP-binding protein
MEIAPALDRNRLFGGLEDRHKASIAAISTRKEIGKRELLFFEGQKAKWVCILESGAIQLVKTSQDGREVVIRTVEEGEVFAEAVLFEQDRYPVTAKVLSQSVVHLVPKTAFLSLLDDRAFRDDFIATLMRRLHYLAERILDLTTASVEERFFGFLLARYGAKESYTIELSKKDIAAAIGVAPETLSRLLLRLTDSGTIAWHGSELVLQPGVWEQRGS